MNSRTMRFLVVAIAVVIGSSAAYFLNDLESRITTQRASVETLRDQAKALSATIAMCRRQVAYVARGQGEAFWMAHVESLLPALQKTPIAFRLGPDVSRSPNRLRGGLGALENFGPSTPGSGVCHH